MAIAATAWIGRDLSELAAQPVVFGLAYLAFALAVAIRFGAIPFHAWAARLTDTVPENPRCRSSRPGRRRPSRSCALAWTDASIAPLLVDLDAVRVVVLRRHRQRSCWRRWRPGSRTTSSTSSATRSSATPASSSWPSRPSIRRPGHRRGSGSSPSSSSRSAFAAWAAAIRTDVLHRPRLGDLRGWAIRSPLLGLAFVLVVLASIGLPGLAIFEARVGLVGLNFEGPLATDRPAGHARAARLLRAPRRHRRRAAGRPDRRRGADADRSSDRSTSRTCVGWYSRTWSDNRAFAATGATLLLTVLAVIVSAGGLGVTEAAVSGPPIGEPAVESFAPDGL